MRITILVTREQHLQRHVSNTCLLGFDTLVAAGSQKATMTAEKESSSPPPSSDTAGDSSNSGGESPVSIMTKVSRHYFGESLGGGVADEEGNDDDDDDDDRFFIDIIENMQEDYGMFVWPCSIALAEYVWQQRTRFSGKYVVELGAGTSLPGLVAAKVGADVVLTDNSTRLEVLENMRRTCEMNKLDCKILGLTWGEWETSSFGLNPQIVLGADVFYDTNDFADLFATVTFLLQRSPGSVFITTYHNRSGHHLIEYLMVKWGWKCAKLLDAFSIMPARKAANLQGNIQLVEIILNNQTPI